MWMYSTLKLGFLALEPSEYFYFYFPGCKQIENLPVSKASFAGMHDGHFIEIFLFHSLDSSFGRMNSWGD